MSTTTDSTPQTHSMGHSMKRKEDPRFIRGHGKYLDDFTLPGMVWMSLVHSPYPHARIVKIDKTAALAVDLVESLFGIVERHRDRINPDVMRPTVRWRGTASELAGSGGATALGRLLVERCGPYGLPWALLGLGILVGMPVFLKSDLSC